MVDAVLSVFATGVTYKLVDMPSRTKLIVTEPPSITHKTLERLSDKGCDLKINVKDQKLHIVIPKQRKRKREETPSKYTGSLSKQYRIEPGEAIMRYILAVPDVCDFDVETQQMGKQTIIRCTNVECIPYSVMKHACDRNAFVCDFPNQRLDIILDGMD